MKVENDDENRKVEKVFLAYDYSSHCITLKTRIFACGQPFAGLS